LLFFQMLFLLFFLAATVIIKLQTDRVKAQLWHTLTPTEQENILIVENHDQHLPVEQLDGMIQKIKSLTTVEDVMFSNYRLSEYFQMSIPEIQISENSEPLRINEHRVEHNFIDFFNLKLKAGRFWTEDDDRDVAVVDETFAALYPDHNPIGQIVRDKRIIGIVEDVIMSRDQKHLPTLYRFANKSLNSYGYTYVKVHPDRRDEALEQIKTLKREFVPDEWDIISVWNFREQNKSLFMQETALEYCASLFSVICLIICLLSIYSAVTMNTEKRRREVAIRKIHGAEMKDILLLFSRTYLVLWTLTCAILFPVIYYAGNLWLSGFAERITLGFAFFAGLYLSVLALICLMIVFRILEVARCNPADVIKKE